MAKKKANIKRRPRSDDKGSASKGSEPDSEGVERIKEENVSKSLGSLSVSEKCDLIASLSEAILEDPESAFTSTIVKRSDGGEFATRQASKMRQLLHLAKEQTSTEDEYVAELATMSLLALFKDIIPSYRIRLPGIKEMAVKVSKDTKKIWDHERALLQHYQEYLQVLEKNWDGAKSSQVPRSLAVTSIISLCELLKASFHFNFRSNLLTAVIRHMNSGVSEQVSQACCSAIEHVFANDAQGDVALEAARQVCRLVKDRGFKVRPAVLRTFCALPLRVHADEAEAAKLATKANAKKRKRQDKELAEIEAEMKEGQARVDKLLLARCQSETLQAVILTYFRILKSENLRSSHIEQLLPPALEGLAKFAHLINIDTVMDLLDVLRELLKQVDALPLDAALNCVLTAFETLQGPGKEMKIDQKEYILPLYSQLPRLASATNSFEHTETMIKCLNAAFINRREFSTVRIAAFLKQILTVAMSTPPHTSVPLLAFCRQLLQRYASVQQMLENEEDVVTSGQFTPTVEDPELSNPFATSAWELATLKFHYEPQVAAQAQAAASLKMLNMPSESPENLRAMLLKRSEELHIPFVRSMKKHPLGVKSKSEASNKKRTNLRFITPRPTAYCSVTGK